MKFIAIIKYMTKQLRVCAENMAPCKVSAEQLLELSLGLQKAGAVTCVCNLSAPTGGGNRRTPEACRPARLVHTVTKRRPKMDGGK